MQGYIQPVCNLMGPNIEGAILDFQQRIDQHGHIGCDPTGSYIIWGVWTFFEETFAKRVNNHDKRQSGTHFQVVAILEMGKLRVQTYPIVKISMLLSSSWSNTMKLTQNLTLELIWLNWYINYANKHTFNQRLAFLHTQNEIHGHFQYKRCLYS